MDRAKPPASLVGRFFRVGSGQRGRAIARSATAVRPGGLGISIAIVTLAALATLDAHNFGTNPPTWNREISRLIYDRCASCHRPEGIAFSLMTYQEAQPHAVAIKDAVMARTMPPWGAVKGLSLIHI